MKRRTLLTVLAVSHFCGLAAMRSCATRRTRDDGRQHAGEWT